MDLLSEGRINYRELQRVAKNMNLPGNLKYGLLVEVIRARKEGKEEVVERILSEQKLERYRRRNEKLMTQESAYQHLHMVPPVRPGAPNVTVSHPEHPPTSDTQLCPTNRAYQCATYVNPRLNVPTTSLMNHVPFPRQVDYHQSSYYPDIRTILQMPPDVFQSFYKRDQEEMCQRIQENHRRNPSMTYEDVGDYYHLIDVNVRTHLLSKGYCWLKNMEEKKLASSTPQKQANLQLTSAPSAHNSFQLLVGTDVTVYEDRKKSFQIKDILNDHGSPSNYVQFNVNQFDMNLPPISEMGIVQEQYFHPIESSSSVDGCPPPSTVVPPTSDPSWRGVYEIPPDPPHFPQVNYSDESGIQQDLPESSSEVSPSSSCETLSGGGGGGEEGGLVSLAAGDGGVLPKEQLQSLGSDCPLPSPELPPPQHILGSDILSRGTSLTGDTFISTTKEVSLIKTSEALSGGGGGERSGVAGGGGVLPKEQLQSLGSDCPLPSPELPPPQHILGSDILSRGTSLTGDTFISTSKEDDLNSIYNSVIIVDSQDYNSQQ